MTESGYYPQGAQYDPNAPYNEIESLRSEKEVEIHCCQTLEKTINEFTSEYEVESDCDEDGEFDNCKISLFALEDIYESDHYTPLQLINMFKRTLEMQLDGKKLPEGLARQYIKECEGWEDKDCYIEGGLV